MKQNCGHDTLYFRILKDYIMSGEQVRLGKSYSYISKQIERMTKNEKRVLSTRYDPTPYIKSIITAMRDIANEENGHTPSFDPCNVMQGIRDYIMPHLSSCGRMPSLLQDEAGERFFGDFIRTVTLLSRKLGYTIFTHRVFVRAHELRIGVCMPYFESTPAPLKRHFLGAVFTSSSEADAYGYLILRIISELVVQPHDQESFIDSYLDVFHDYHIDYCGSKLEEAFGLFASNHNVDSLASALMCGPKSVLSVYPSYRVTGIMRCFAPVITYFSQPEHAMAVASAYYSPNFWYSCRQDQFRHLF